MSNYTKIPHPLLSDSGTCQSERYPALLNPNSIKIDDQQLEDVLNFINKYARFINYYEAEKINESSNGENYEINISNWKELFSKSIPFQLAALSKIDVDELSFNLSRILQLVDEFPTQENFQILLDFIFTELILIFESSLNNIKKVETSFGIVLQRTMSSSLRDPLENFISLTKKLVNLSSLKGLNIADKITLENWDIVELNSIEESPLNSAPAIVQALERNANLFLNELKSLAAKTSNFLPQVLYPNEESQQGKIGPHIGLLIAFLNLQKRFVNDLNDITRRHLLYFYNDVLQIKGKPARPDETFVVFELQKQVESSYFLPKGTKVKDGKDDNKADIIFGLEKDIVLDKAEIKELRTLYLNPVFGYLKKAAAPIVCDKGDLEKFTEGLYIAPKANSLDGIEEDFTEDPKNWATLGAKESKLLVGIDYQEHPPARIGFVLASPVLFLNEGHRTINVLLDCSIDDPDGELSTDLYNKIKTTSIQPFKIYLSGKEEWLEVPDRAITFSLTHGIVTKIEIKIELSDDFPAVTFSDVEVLGEEIGSIQPSMKIELDPNKKWICASEKFEPCCTLLHCQESKDIDISVYHFFKFLKIDESCIDVEVCGVKNLIVQNDESIQDVNGLVYPFGTRPNVADFNREFFFDISDLNKNLVGPNFYIGSKEVFLKNWKDVYLNLSWKDKPTNFNEHYLAYRFLDGDGDGAITPGSATDIYGLNEDEFEINLSILKDGIWVRELDDSIVDTLPSNINIQNVFTNHYNRRLFEKDWANTVNFPRCRNYYDPSIEDPFDQVIKIENNNFLAGGASFDFKDSNIEIDSYDIDTRDGFLRITLENQDFLHKEYAFVMARQMMALGNITSGDALEGAVYIDSGSGTIIVFNNISGILFDLALDIDAACLLSMTTSQKAEDLKNALLSLQTEVGQIGTELSNAVPDVVVIATEFADVDILLNDLLDGTGNSAQSLSTDSDDVETIACRIRDNKNALNFLSKFFNNSGTLKKPLEVPIPNEPWTPIIKDITLDYTAKAEATDIQLIHLYPFESTYSLEDITTAPSLLPVFTDEGTLFIALDNITKGNVLNLLFNMAEATANTEMSKPKINWSYLSSNIWKDLKPGFGVSNDGTDGLTKSGIVEIILPADINRDENTIMPDQDYWIKVATSENSKAVCETISIHTQAAKIKAVFSPENDLKRLSTPLEAEKINRLDRADTSIKKVSQPIPSYNGRPPESEAPTLLYRRISERLRHKGRAIARFDYERITLENFPQVFKAKTINHTLGLPGNKFVRDLEIVAPGHVVVAVIPNIQELNSGNILEPRVPLSQLGQIKDLLQKKNSPFIELKVLNPRYEKINVAINVKFQKGNTGAFFEKKLEQDIKQFLAPWMIGKTDRLEFGSILAKSDLIYFVEKLSYVDFICQIDWILEFDLDENCTLREISCTASDGGSGEFISPLTARSILTAGEVTVCELLEHCESYDSDVPCEKDKGQVVL